MRIIGAIFAAGAFPPFVASVVLAVEDHSVGGLSVEIAFAVIFLAGCVLLAGAKVAGAIERQQRVPDQGSRDASR